jgi:hypothetical protein
MLAPLKAVLRKLMRWYVEPAFAHQRDFNSRSRWHSGSRSWKIALEEPETRTD